MSKIRNAILIIIVMLTSSLYGAAPLSLAEVIEEAILNSPTLDSKRRDITIAELEIKNKFSQFLPQLDFKSEHGFLFGTPRKVDNNLVSSMSVVMSESLYDSGRSQSAYRIAKLQLEAQQLSYNEQRDHLVLAVTLKFFQTSLKKILIVEAEQKHLSIKKQYDFANQIFQQGLKRKSEVQRFKAQMERAEISLVQARNDFNLSLSSLKILLGKSSETPIEFDLTKIPTEGKNLGKLLPSSITVDIDNYISVRQLKINKKIQDEVLDLSRSVNSPDLRLASRLSYGTQQYLGPSLGSNPPEMRFFTGIELNFPIWDWGTNRRNIEKNAEQVIQSSNAITIECNSVSDKVKQMSQGLELAIRTHHLNEDLLKIEQDNFTQIEKEYKTSKASILDLITATDNLATARTALLQSFYDKISFQAQVLFYQGKIYDWPNS